MDLGSTAHDAVCGKLMYAAFFRGSRRSILLRAASLIVAIAVLDWRIVGDIPLGFLYLFPMLLAGSVLSPRSSSQALKGWIPLPILLYSLSKILLIMGALPESTPPTVSL